MSKQGLVVKGMMDYASVVNFLEDFIKSFKEKTVCVQRGEDFITLTPSDSMEVEIEASIKKGKQKVAIELEWREEVQVENDVAFKVSSVEPEPKPEPESEPESEIEAEKKAEPAAEETPVEEKKEEPSAAEEIKNIKEEVGAAASSCAKSVDVAPGSPSILAPTPTSKPVEEAKAEPAAPAKGGPKSAAKNKPVGAKKTTSSSSK